MRNPDGGPRLRVHRLIANAPDGMMVHHINGIRSDNRPENLMVVTPKQHSMIHNQKHPITKKCVVCGAEFTPHPTKRARQQSCGGECFSRLQSIRQKGKPKPRKKSDRPAGGSVLTTPRRTRAVKSEAEKAADRLRRKAIKKRGERWQDLLAEGFKVLAAPHDIAKVEPPVKIIRPTAAGRYEVIFTRSGDADFRGGYRGIITAIEAKDTGADQLELREIDEAQSEALERVHRQGGIALVAVRFGPENAFRCWALPWSSIAAMRAGGMRVLKAEYLAHGEFEAYRIGFGASCGKMVALLDAVLEESYWHLPSSARAVAGRGEQR